MVDRSTFIRHVVSGIIALPVIGLKNPFVKGSEHGQWTTQYMRDPGQNVLLASYDEGDYRHAHWYYTVQDAMAHVVNDQDRVYVWGPNVTTRVPLLQLKGSDWWAVHKKFGD